MPRVSVDGLIMHRCDVCGNFPAIVTKGSYPIYCHLCERHEDAIVEIKNGRCCIDLRKIDLIRKTAEEKILRYY